MRDRFVRRPLDLVMAAVGVAVLGLCAAAIHPNQASSAEEVAFHALNGLPDFLYWPVWVVMQLGNLVAIPVAALVTAVFRRWRLAGAILLAGVAKTFLSRAVKDVVTRERPASVIDDVIRRGDASDAGEAFVSGHAVIAFALAVLVYPYLPTRLRWVPWVMAAGVGLGRIYVGAHLPLDIVGGAALGTAVGLLLRYAFGTPDPSSMTVRDPSAPEHPAAA